MNDHVKIIFNTVQIAEGYPPDAYEGIWAKLMANGNYEIDNIPFFIYNISAGDEVSANEVDGELFFSELVSKSGNSTFRVISVDKDKSSYLRDKIKEFDCITEYNGRLNLIAVEVPESVNIKPFLDFIMKAKSKNELDYDEGALRHVI